MKITKPLGRHGGRCWAWLRWLAWLVFANPSGVMAQTASSTSSTALTPSPAPSLASVAAVPASSDSNLPKADRVISLNFQDVPLKTLLQVFADFSGLNLVAAEGVGGQVTVRVTDVP